MNNTPLGKNPDKNDQNVQFKTEDIGRWASRQEDPFAEQNRKTAAKKQERNRKRQKVAPIFIIIASAILSIAAVVGLVFLIIHLVSDPLPENITPGSTGATEVGQSAQDVYNKYLESFYNKNQGENGEDKGSIENPSEEAINGALNAVEDYFNNRTDSVSEESKRIDLVIIEMGIYAKNDQPEKVIEAGKKVDAGNMSDEQKAPYWGMLMNACFNLNNMEAAQHYLELLNQFPDSGDVIG